MINYENYAIHKGNSSSRSANLAKKLTLAAGIVSIIGASVSTAAAALALQHTELNSTPSNSQQTATNKSHSPYVNRSPY